MNLPSPIRRQAAGQRQTMKNMSIILMLFICTLHIPDSYAQSDPDGGTGCRGILLESLSMESGILQKKVLYPVVYLLHGYSDDETAWIQFGEVHLAADRAIAGREIPPMIIVMPDAGVSWYINDHERTEYRS